MIERGIDILLDDLSQEAFEHAARRRIERHGGCGEVEVVDVDRTEHELVALHRDARRRERAQRDIERVIENPWIDEDSPESREIFQDGLETVLKELALMIVRDGEGATKCITIRVCGAREDVDAERVARTVANSNLVKTAFFGEDANWGRIIAAMGRSGVRFNPEVVDIAFNDVVIVRNGTAVGGTSEAEADRVLKEKAFTVCFWVTDVYL